MLYVLTEPVFSYLLNPYILLPSLAFSTSSIENMLCLLAIMLACRGAFL